MFIGFDKIFYVFAFAVAIVLVVALYVKIGYKVWNKISGRNTRKQSFSELMEDHLPEKPKQRSRRLP